MKNRVINSLSVTSMVMQTATIFIDYEYFFNMLSFGICIFTLVMISGNEKGDRKYIGFSIAGVMIFLSKLVFTYILTSINF